MIILGASFVVMCMPYQDVKSVVKLEMQASKSWCFENRFSVIKVMQRETLLITKYFSGGTTKISWCLSKCSRKQKNHVSIHTLFCITQHLFVFVSASSSNVVYNYGKHAIDSTQQQQQQQQPKNDAKKSCFQARQIHPHCCDCRLEFGSSSDHPGTYTGDVTLNKK